MCLAERKAREKEIQKNPPAALADMAWSIFTGLVIWEESKKMFNPGKDYLRTTLDLAFKVFRTGIEKRN
jgi:hypothetical protein